MIKPWVIVVIGCLLCIPIISNAADAKAVTLGFSIGHYDIDTENSSDPHVNGRTYSLLLGYEWSKYFAVELEWSSMQRQTDADVFDRELAFEAAAVGLSGRLQWPLDEHIKAYARLGAAQFELQDARFSDCALDTPVLQPMLGAGLRGDFWFAEYVYYGKLEELIVEQLRAGLVFRF